MLPGSSPWSMINGSWYTNIPVLSTLGWDNSEARVLHWIPKFLSWPNYYAPFLGCVPFSYFLTSQLVFSSVLQEKTCSQILDSGSASLKTHIRTECLWNERGSLCFPVPNLPHRSWCMKTESQQPCMTWARKSKHLAGNFKPPFLSPLTFVINTHTQEHYFT